MNCPIAVPIFCRKSPPSETSHSNPGICANAPMAANTIANSDITAPKANTPTIAPAANAVIALSANIKAVIAATPARNVIGSIVPSALAALSVTFISISNILDTI